MTVTLATGREPYKLTVMSWFLIYGVMSVFAYDRVASAAIRNFPVPWGRAFLVLIGICSAAVIASAIRDTIYTALRWELPALIILNMAFLIYAIWSYQISGERGVVLSGTLLFLAPAGMARMVQILVFRARANKVRA